MEYSKQTIRTDRPSTSAAPGKSRVPPPEGTDVDAHHQLQSATAKASVSGSSGELSAKDVSPGPSSSGSNSPNTSPGSKRRDSRSRRKSSASHQRRRSSARRQSSIGKRDGSPMGLGMMMRTSSQTRASFSESPEPHDQSGVLGGTLCIKGSICDVSDFLDKFHICSQLKASLCHFRFIYSI